MILTNDIKPNDKLMGMLKQTDIPVMMAKGESYTVTSKINSMTVKTQPNDSDKIPLIKKLVQEHIEMSELLKAI